MRAPRILMGGLLAVMALVTSVSATTVVRMKLPDLVERSAVIVEGQVLSTKAVHDARGLIVTEVTVSVDSGLKGVGSGQRFVFTTPGGELGGRRMVVPGMPSYESGDEVFLFLTAPSKRGWRMPVGLSQGSFRIRRNPATGARMLDRDLTGLELVDAKTGKAVSRPERRGVAYESLVGQVTALLEEQR